jgi:hypothetical protein
MICICWDHTSKHTHPAPCRQTQPTTTPMPPKTIFKNWGKVNKAALVAGFKEASAIGFDTCAGVIDGILKWMQKPTINEAKRVGVGQKKFLCGRKHKFGSTVKPLLMSTVRYLISVLLMALLLPIVLPLRPGIFIPKLKVAY